MPIVKESSDELNPAVVTQGVLIGRARPARTPADYLALGLATWGVGLLPGAPGTYGSAVGVGIYALFHEVFTRLLPFPALVESSSTLGGIDDLLSNTMQTARLRMVILLAFVLLLTWVGVWAASRTEKLLNRKDPGIVVVDEVAGQLLALLFVPLLSRNLKISWQVVVAGFLLFRLFDIWKPYPIRRLEALESGLGIMADDVLAGVYAAATLMFVVAAINFLN